MKMKKYGNGGSKDVTGDGVYTQKDLLVQRGVLKKKGDKIVKAAKGKFYCKPKKMMAGAYKV